ncbi:MAG TPA: DUF4189 domain-containing protein [Xanthobacteraceae bacterium]|nr:DUF4189 domain-containing protein [Xanthobacteraceae bacterium]
MSSTSSRTFRAGAAVAAVCAMALAGGTTAANAFGALAVGQTNSVAKDGIAMGTSWNWGSADEANDHALQNCRKWKDKGAPKAADLCRVIATYHNECYAVSLDPKPGTPGAGWAIAADKETAEERAIAHCKLTAGPDREKYCELSESNCDQK